MVRNGAQFDDDRKRTKVFDLVRPDFDAALYVGFCRQKLLSSSCLQHSFLHFAYPPLTPCPSLLQSQARRKHAAAAALGRGAVGSMPRLDGRLFAASSPQQQQQVRFPFCRRNRKKPGPGHSPTLNHHRCTQRRRSSALRMLSVSEATALQDACSQSPGVLLDLRAGGWGLLSVTGEDRLRFLHNQLTNSFTDLKPGQVLESSYTSSTGRTIDLVTAYVLQDEVLLLSSPSRHEQLLGAFNKYIFPLDR